MTSTLVPPDHDRSTLTIGDHRGALLVPRGGAGRNPVPVPECVPGVIEPLCVEIARCTASKVLPHEEDAPRAVGYGGNREIVVGCNASGRAVPSPLSRSLCARQTG